MIRKKTLGCRHTHHHFINSKQIYFYLLTCLSSAFVLKIFMELLSISISHVQLSVTPMDCSTPGFPVLHCLHSLLKFMSIKSMMLSNHLILCCPLLLLPSIFPSVRIFSNELALHIRWPKDWSFSFSIYPSNEYSGLISFRTDLFDPF